MRAFVIGGSGLVGRAVARRLIGSGWDVDVVGRSAATVPADLAASFVAADRDDPAARSPRTDRPCRRATCPTPAARGTGRTRSPPSRRCSPRDCR
ncbi:NAD-dependent epimerase/dehydratase family protein [Jatrophihabitans sp.]|uniref:NAD-dependent epimerase/dehydratase family protein n=1 Tax=Jatrophihabitans sp. TaxID=1932789 RepID=UPI0032C23364